MNSVFNIKRFWTYLKREMVFDHKLLIQVSGVVAVAIVVYLFFAKVIDRASLADFIVGLICGLGVIFVAYFTSEISSCFKNKPICVDFLTVPASMLEKYLTKLIKHFLIPSLLYICAWKVFQFIEDPTHPLFEFSRADKLIVTIILYESALFLFAGVFFRRFAALWLIGINSVLSTLFGACALFINFMPFDPIRVYLQTHVGSRLTLALITSVCFMLLSIIVSYFIYRRKELHVKPFNW